MKRLIFTLFSSFLIIFSGCANRGYTQADVGNILVNYKGTVVHTREVNIKDSGEGTILGAIIGGIIGHQIGKGTGKGVATAAGAIAGGLAGNRLNQDIGQEVTIDLDNHQEVTTIIRVDKKHPYWLRPGDRVMVYVKGNRIVKISPIFNERVR